MGDARLELESILEGPPDDPQRRAAPASRGRRLALATVLSLLLLGLGYGLAGLRSRPADPLERVQWVASGMGNPDPQVNQGGRDLAITPDGSKIIYIVEHGSGQALFVRSVDRLEGEILNGTETDRLLQTPFVSPDGEWVGYWDLGDFTLKRVSLTGGGSVPIATAREAGFLTGATWGEDGTIVLDFGHHNHLRSVRASGVVRSKI